LSGEKPGIKPRGRPRSGNVPVIDISKENDLQPGSQKPAEIPHPGESALQGKAGRPFWSGTITIGLVNVPVRLHTMVRDLSVSFRLLHRTDGQPLRYDRVCTKDDKVIPWSETVKGY